MHSRVFPKIWSCEVFFLCFVVRVIAVVLSPMRNDLSLTNLLENESEGRVSVEGRVELMVMANDLQ